MRCKGNPARPVVRKCGEDVIYSTGIYSVGITGLTPNTTYHFISYVTNSVGTATSSDQTFTTLAEVVEAEPIPSHSSGGGGTHYGCKEVGALNYEQFAASNPSLCLYPSTQAGLGNSNSVTVVQFLELLIQIGVIAPEKAESLLKLINILKSLGLV